jgi:hypothetical protein
MTLVAAPRSIFPAKPWLLANNTSTNFTFDASTDRICAVFQILVSGTVDKVHYRVNTVSSPVMTHRIELRTVDATTGLPNTAGTLYGSSTSITVDASTYAAGTNYTAAIAATVTAGDLVALVFDLSAFTSGSFAQLDRMGTILGDAPSSNRSTLVPYGIRNTAASDVLNTIMPGGFLFEYASSTYHPVTANYLNAVGTSSSATVTNSGTTRRGNKFTPVVPRRAIGIHATLDLDGSVTLTLRLASDGSLLATATPDKDVRGNTGITDGFWLFDSGATYNLAVGTAYYIGVEGQDATGATVYYHTFPSSGALGAMPGGTGCFGFTYAGSYSDANTTIYAISLVTDQEDDGTGGGGLMTHPGMVGGMRG